MQTQELPQSIVNRYRIKITNYDTHTSYHIHWSNDMYVGVTNPKIIDKQNTWDLVSPQGTVISLYKNVDYIHTSIVA